MTTALAIYAAMVATGGIAWQIYTWRHGRRPHIVVTVEMAYPMTLTGPTPPMIAITAISHTNHPVRATNAGIRADSVPGQTAWGVRPHPLSSIPGVIPPHDSAQSFVDAQSLVNQGVDLHQPLCGAVRLSTGEIALSEPTVLEP
ncbi:MAG: hypothetical protein ACLP50_33160 [Solirubrobacteraceae bacterium]